MLKIRFHQVNLMAYHYDSNLNTFDLKILNITFDRNQESYKARSACSLIRMPKNSATEIHKKRDISKWIFNITGLYINYIK